MNTCQNCKNPLTGRNKKFCSKRCLTISNGKKTGGWNRNKITLKCQRCNKEYEVSKCRIGISKFCSRICLNITNSESFDKKGNLNPTWKGGISKYRHIGWSYFEKKCSNCGSNKNVEIHHLNSNRYDNRIENLKPVCRKCHQEIDGRIRNRCDKGRFISNDVLDPSEPFSSS